MERNLAKFQKEEGLSYVTQLSSCGVSPLVARTQPHPGIQRSFLSLQGYVQVCPQILCISVCVCVCEQTPQWVCDMCPSLPS